MDERNDCVAALDELSAKFAADKPRGSGHEDAAVRSRHCCLQHFKAWTLRYHRLSRLCALVVPRVTERFDAAGLWRFPKINRRRRDFRKARKNQLGFTRAIHWLACLLSTKADRMAARCPVFGELQRHRNSSITNARVRTALSHRRGDPIFANSDAACFQHALAIFDCPRNEHAHIWLEFAPIARN
jgi:hypothetical protein